MASTAKRWMAAGMASLAVAALGGGCNNGVDIDDYVRRIFDLQCRRIFSCCDAASQKRLAFAGTEEDCRAHLGSFEQLAVSAVRADIEAGLTVIDEGALLSCLSAMEATSCADYFQHRDRSCERAFHAQVANGGDCSSDLACRGGACVSFRCEGDSRPLDAGCASDDVCESGSCVDDHCAMNPNFMACDGSLVGK